MGYLPNKVGTGSSSPSLLSTLGDMSALGLLTIDGIGKITVVLEVS